MNAFNYFFEYSGRLDKNFLLNTISTLSFRNLYDQCKALSAFIRERFGENNNILLISTNSAFFITVYLAIIRSGNICIPLNPEIENKNLKFIVEKTGSKILFIQELLTKKISLEEADKFTEKVFQNLPSSPQKEDFSLAFDSDRIAEIIFTSGSTGEPKGVMISHKNLIANTESILGYLNLTEKDTMLVVMPFYYCYGLSLLHTHLRAGGSLVLNNTFILLGGILNDLKKYKCTGFAGVPSHFQILLRKSDTFKKTLFPDLKYVTQAGGKLHSVFIDEFNESFPHIHFYVMYGQTEATARLSCLPPDMLNIRKGSIGKGIPGVILKVVNEQGQKVKPGETGEIIAKGDNIMTGYYKEPEETNRTIRNGWLYTGDLATVDEEGYIFLTARKKEIIKVAGKRISPKEIEEVIVSIPQVVDCTIEAIYDPIQGEAVKALVTVSGTDNGNITSEYIQQFCSEHLASYKIPRLIEIRDKISISGTGKKIRKST